MQALFNLERAVEVWIVDQTFPANRGTRLFKVNPHHNEQAVFYRIGQLAQAASVVECSIDIVDRAGANHDQQTWIAAVENILDSSSTLDDRLFRYAFQRNFLLEGFGSNQDVLGQDVEVVDLLI